MTFRSNQAIGRPMNGHILVIDQGTTSTRAIVFGPDVAPVATGQQEFRQIFPQPGWVEHDPEDIWRSALATGREALSKAGLEASALAGIGIANQRETTLVWSRATGRPIYNAIVWQDRRTAPLCADLKERGYERLIAKRTGLLLDPYFSATKIAWLLDNVPGARGQAERGELAFGTVDSFLLWRLTNGRTHTTDATNASRTLLLDIHSGAWDDDLLALFGVPRSMLPEVRDCAAEFGVAAPEHFGAALPVLGVAGDQQAALIGQACFQPGMVKSTFGTGGFVLLNTGSDAVASTHKLLTTIAYQWKGERAYALEGSIFSAGATVQWLRDGLGIIVNAAETGALAADADAAQRVYFVPAFTGLGAPHWNSEARGAITGLTRGATRKEIVRAALESVAYQTRDLVAAMQADGGGSGDSRANAVIRIDGGMSASDWTMQFLADMLDAPVDRPAILETTALGAAFLAGWQAGIYPGPEEFARSWRAERRFAPSMPREERASRYRGWRDAIGRNIAPSTA
jgi:glycerol kinase